MTIFHPTLSILHCIDCFASYAFWEVQSWTDDWVFPAVNQNYGDSQRTLKHRRKQKGTKYTNHDWQTWPAEVSFCFQRGPLRWLTTAKNVNCWLKFEFRSSHDIENCNEVLIWNNVAFRILWLIKTHLSTKSLKYKKSLAAKLVPGIYLEAWDNLPKKKNMMAGTFNHNSYT